MKLIVRVDKNWGIGLAGDLQCPLPEDMAFFRSATKGATVIMGRTTLESFPGGRPLKGRTNIVLTRSAAFAREGVVTVPCIARLALALQQAGADPDNIFCIGGAAVYRQLLPYCDTALITHMDIACEADAWFPALDKEPGWSVAEAGETLVSEGGIPYRISTWRNACPLPLPAADRAPALDRVRGSLLAGAAGDALGYAVEFMGTSSIRKRYGQQGVTGYALTDGVAQISDDTQMTLFTAAGLLYASTRGHTRGILGPWAGYIHQSYLDWYHTQTAAAPDPARPAVSWLAGLPALYSRRAPGNTCLGALGSGSAGAPAAPINRSKGCGGVMRVAPVGLYFKDLPIEQVDAIAAEAAALTHGHPLGWIPAAALAHIVHRLVHGGMALPDAVQDMLATLAQLYADVPELPEFEALVRKAVALAATVPADVPDADLAAIRQLGEGWVGDEALAIALYCALRYPTDIRQALIAAVNHDGDSDSTGAVCGNILGAALGMSAIPAQYLEKLELRDVICEVADDLVQDCPITEYSDSPDPLWKHKYLMTDYPEKIK